MEEIEEHDPNWIDDYVKGASGGTTVGSAWWPSDPATDADIEAYSRRPRKNAVPDKQLRRAAELYREAEGRRDRLKWVRDALSAEYGGVSRSTAHAWIKKAEVRGY